LSRVLLFSKGRYSRPGSHFSDQALKIKILPALLGPLLPFGTTFRLEEASLAIAENSHGVSILSAIHGLKNKMKILRPDH